MTKHLFVFAVALALVVGCKDNKTDEDACPDGTVYNDCSLRGVCGGDPFGLSLCRGDIINYCGEPTNPCWTGSQKFERDCAASSSRCFNTEENGCGGMCLPLTDFVPVESFDGEWRERSGILCDTGQEVSAIQKRIARISFRGSDEFFVNWEGDDTRYTGHYENSKIQGHYTTRLSLDAPYPLTAFCDYLFMKEADSLTLHITNGAEGSCLYYNGVSRLDDMSYCGHIFERIPDEQPDDDALLTDAN